MSSSPSTPTHRLDGGTTLKVLLDLGGVFAIELVDLSVESHVPLVDEIDISIRLVDTLATVSLAFLHPTKSKAGQMTLLESDWPV